MISMISRRAPRGAVLLVVLWLLAIVGVLALSLARQASLALHLAACRRDYGQALHLAEAGVAYASAELLREVPPSSSVSLLHATDGILAVDHGTTEEAAERVRYQIIDEERKINLQTLAARPDGLAILQRWPGMTEALAAALLNRCRAAPIRSVEELLLVSGVSDELLRGWREHLTVTSSGLLNLNTASSRTLCLLGLLPDVAERLVAYRARARQRAAAGAPPFKTLTGRAVRTQLEEDGTPLTAEEIENLNRVCMSPSLLTLRSSHFTVTATGVARRGRVRATVEALVAREGTRLHLLAWHER